MDARYLAFAALRGFDDHGGRRHGTGSQECLHAREERIVRDDPGICSGLFVHATAQHHWACQRFGEVGSSIRIVKWMAQLTSSTLA